MTFRNKPLIDNNHPVTIAAVDLGSNSFHLLIGKTKKTNHGFQIIPIDNLKSPVKLASGLDEKKILNKDSQDRALLALKRFAERLRALSPNLVRVVATNTFRVAKNRKTFLRDCEESLGFPIEIINGPEEARLIYKGVANSLDDNNQKRLVIDIGGGSTEFVIGKNSEPKLMESIFVGCIKINNDFFPNNVYDAEKFSKSVFFARKEIQVITKTFKNEGWDIVYGCSGTVKSIHDTLVTNKICSGGITISDLEKLIGIISLNCSKNIESILGVKSDRANLFYGGLSILYAIFKELKIERMELSGAALRLGVLYDIVGRERKENIRDSTIEKFIERYEIDRTQIERVKALTLYFWNQFDFENQLEQDKLTEILCLSSMLLEIGHSVSHNSYHKHSSYIVMNSDMPGFSRSEQQIVAKIILGHIGKLSKVSELINDSSLTQALLCIRLASIFSRSRVNLQPPKMILQNKNGDFTLKLPKSWIDSHPLTKFTLDQESKEWSKVSKNFIVKHISELEKFAA